MSRVRWGQCFLVDRDACRRIVEWAGVDGATVVEVGPGRGALTALLRARASRLVLVEIDPALAEALATAWAGDDAVTVVRADALRVAWAEVAGVPFRVVANLPYESGTAILASLLAARGLVLDVVVMLQKEVVARLAAAPGSKAYGALTVLVRMFADVEKGMVLAPRSFRPSPAVESQMVRVTPLAGPRHPLGREEDFRALVHAAFGQRRKMLRNNLGRFVDSRLGAGSAARVMEAAGVAGDVRPEDLGLEQFAALGRAFADEAARAGEEAVTPGGEAATSGAGTAPGGNTPGEDPRGA